MSFASTCAFGPDPSSTPAGGLGAPAAFDYYESVGQNWERAAFIKARAGGGRHPARGRPFLGELEPFVWRRNLDFAAIADIHSIKRQIHADDGRRAPDAPRAPT